MAMPGSVSRALGNTLSRRKHWLCCAIVLSLACPLAAQDQPASKPTVAPRQTIRCAVIGGMMDAGLWPAVAERFEKATGHRVLVTATAPKHEIAKAFALGEADLITMHASDTIINLVADGAGENPQPWARNDLVIAGPASDPAGIRGHADAVEALAKIIESKQPLLVHASNGANEVLSNLLAAGELELDPEHTISLPSDRHRQMLRRAAEAKAYVVVGRIPFLSGKIPSDGMEIMVQGDRRLRRPYLVVVARAEKPNDPRHLAAQELAEFLRSKETQAWLKEFGRGKWDDRPLFFPVNVPDKASNKRAEQPMEQLGKR